MKQETLKLIADSIASIPDYPKAGIVFRDITSLVENAAAFKASIDTLVELYRHSGITKVLGTEARGFIFGAPVAAALGVGFIPARKPGKLPREVIEVAYDLEYGQDRLQIHVDSIAPGEKVLIIDDLLATGGTVEAAVKLVRRCGGEVQDAAFVIALPALGGLQRLNNMGIRVSSLVQFDGH
ncbi:adenine phosphoribosyltransferase [Oceanisphaera litoralis]|uniref:adenine phosphoribosyltransferase n=1 Tax=Oceanisphaera litoralis TaxID=225144 RepID=UPI00195C5072|nr:adenine phosphoribosyltransferase [Oceanisphaera litoralis]MBM7455932.1 adenine phosphoribosyltransferase [Oceanisphaera litoralis]